MSRIRPVALCVFRKEGKILVMMGRDPLSREPFFRPLGGSVEFGEVAADAARREILEEVSEEITQPELLGVLESIFDYGGRLLHEIVFVFEAHFADPRVYEREKLEAVEADGTPLEVKWVSLEGGVGEPPIRPKGLRALLS